MKAGTAKPTGRPSSTAASVALRRQGSVFHLSADIRRGSFQRFPCSAFRVLGSRFVRLPANEAWFDRGMRAARRARCSGQPPLNSVRSSAALCGGACRRGSLDTATVLCRSVLRSARALAVLARKLLGRCWQEGGAVFATLSSSANLNIHRNCGEKKDPACCAADGVNAVYVAESSALSDS